MVSRKTGSRKMDLRLTKTGKQTERMITNPCATRRHVDRGRTEKGRKILNHKQGVYSVGKISVDFMSRRKPASFLFSEGAVASATLDYKRRPIQSLCG